MSKKKKSGITDDFAQFLMGDKKGAGKGKKASSKEKSAEKSVEESKSVIVPEPVDPTSYNIGDDTLQVNSNAADEAIGEDVDKQIKEDIGANPEVDDATINLQAIKDAEKEPEAETPDLLSKITEPSKNRLGVDKLVEKVEKGGVGRDGRIFFSAEASLAQSEHLRIAQNRILDLENTVEQLRMDNEQLVAIGESLRNRSEKLEVEKEGLDRHFKETESCLKEEGGLLKVSLDSKTKEISELKLKIEELETRLQRDLKQVRVRERELENRLEIVKLEEAALVRNKNETILELKRKTDQLLHEMNNYRERGRELHGRLESNRDKVRRTVKALRLALSMLEGDEEELAQLKKVD